jgi:hypothetical protein
MTVNAFHRLAMLGALACLALLTLRIHGTMSLAEPLQVISSGDEESSLFALWKFLQGEPIYKSRFAEPFSNIGYNWLFYQAYGAAAKAGLQALSLDAAWIPTLGRCLTLAGSLVIALVCHRLFARLLPLPGAGAAALAFGIFLGAGPLIGFWAVTVRPDIWGFALEVSAIAVFLRFYPSRKWLALAGFVALAYASWSFRQTNVFAIGAVGLFFLLRRQWVMAGALTAAMIGLWALTLAAGSEAYRSAMLFLNYPLVPSVSHGLQILAGNVALKSPPTLFLLAGLALSLAAKPALIRQALGSDAVLLALCGTLASGAISLPTSMHTGASENYFFLFSFYLCLLALALLGELARLNPASLSLALGFGGAGWLVLAFSVGLVLAGFQGSLGLRGQHADTKAIMACSERLPRPLFIDSPTHSLPWITPGTTPYVLSYIFKQERQMGRAFEHDGIGGLIAKGKFATLILGKSVESFDGAALDGFEKAAIDCAGLYVYVRKSAKEN